VPHLALITTDGDTLGAVEFEQADPANGTLIEHEGALVRVAGRVEVENPSPEHFVVLVVEQLA